MPLAEGLYPGEGAYIRMYFSFTGKWPYNWGLISGEGEGAGHISGSLRRLRVVPIFPEGYSRASETQARVTWVSGVSEGKLKGEERSEKGR